MKRKSVIIMGAGGRDFHNFLMFYKHNPFYEVKCFTAAQIPHIENRVFPAKLAGKLYPKGIPIYPEKKLEELIEKFSIDKVVFAYSDVSHEEIMHKASIALSHGADFIILGEKETMLKSKKPVIAVCAVRTGAGKSQTTRKIVEILKKNRKKAVVIRHPMPYGDLTKQECQRFATYSDLEEQQATIEEREEFEPLIEKGIIVFAGVDYKKILKKAEKESDAIVFDGGNNDTSFIKPDLLFVVTDPFRAGHETRYHPGETNFRQADCIIINKVNTANPKNVKEIGEKAKELNPKAIIIKANSEITAQGIQGIKGKKVIVIEDGPTLTHGNMPFGAGYLIAKKFKAKLVSVEKNSVGEIKEVLKKYKRLRKILPAMGYTAQEIRELEETINKTKADYIVSATPIDLGKIIKCNKPIIRVKYELKEKFKPGIEEVMKKFKII